MNKQHHRNSVDAHRLHEMCQCKQKTLLAPPLPSPPPPPPPPHLPLPSPSPHPQQEIPGSKLTSPILKAVQGIIHRLSGIHRKHTKAYMIMVPLKAALHATKCKSTTQLLNRKEQELLDRKAEQPSNNEEYVAQQQVQSTLPVLHLVNHTW